MSKQCWRCKVCPARSNGYYTDGAAFHTSMARHTDANPDHELKVTTVWLFGNNAPRRK